MTLEITKTEQKQNQPIKKLKRGNQLKIEIENIKTFKKAFFLFKKVLLII